MSKRFECSSLTIGGVLEAPCVIIETSAGGASVRLRADLAVCADMPATIHLGNESRAARVAWRDGDKVGLQFT